METIHKGYSVETIIDYINGEYALYLRKSRADMEAEARGEGETLARHERMLLELAVKHNLLIGKIYREKIISGETIDSRPVVQELLRDVQNHRWKGVLVVEVERLARGDTMDQGRVAKSFKLTNTKIITPIKIFDPSNEFDEEYFEFGLFMSRREYKVINRRLQNGRITSVNEGKYVGSIAPFGYDRVKIKNDKGYTLEPNEEARIVKMMFNWYAYTDMNFYDVMRKLNELGEKPRITDKWSISAVKDILSNPVYIGKIKWNSRKVVKEYKNGKIVERRPRNQEYILVDGLHPALTDIDTWNIVQEKRKNNAPSVIRDNQVKNPLVGIVYCAKCGKTMQRRPYYDGRETSLICPNADCDNISSKLYIVEDKLISSLREWLKNYEIDFDDYFERKDNFRKSTIEQSIKKLEKELNILNKKLSNVYDFFEEGTYTKEMFSERCNMISKQIETTSNSILEYKKQLDEELMREEGRKEIVPKVKNVLDIYNKLDTPEEKNDLLKTVVKKVMYLKTERAIKKTSDPTNFELDIYPNIV